MRPYNELEQRGQVARLRPYAIAALDAYSLTGARMTFINHGENTTWKIDSPTPPAGWDPIPGLHPTRCLLRIHRTTYNWPQEIRSELLWTRALARDTGMAIPIGLTPSTAAALRPISDPAIGGQRLITLTRWVIGQSRWEHPKPSDFEQIGVLMAHLHDHASQWRPPKQFTRPHYRDRGLAIPDGNSDRGCGDVWHLLPKNARRLLKKVRDRTLKVMEQLGDGPEAFGLIHGDLHLHNVVFARGCAWPIDFDDCLYGHWLLDYAVASQPYPGSAEPILRGYRRVRPFLEAWLRHLPLFHAARSAGVLLWLVSRAETNSRFVAIMKRSLPKVMERCANIGG